MIALKIKYVKKVKMDCNNNKLKDINISWLLDDAHKIKKLNKIRKMLKPINCFSELINKILLIIKAKR